MEERPALRRATQLWREAYRYQMRGKVDRAIELYRHSIEVIRRQRHIPSWGGP
jgi:hypothetical protein